MVMLYSIYLSKNSPKNYIRLKYIAFCIPEEGQQFFYHWQRQRKIWWRKVKHKFDIVN